MNGVSIMRSDDAWIFVASFGTALSLNATSLFPVIAH